MRDRLLPKPDVLVGEAAARGPAIGRRRGGRMSRPVPAGIIGLLAIIGLGSIPVAAGDACDCYGPTAHYVVYAPRAYDYEPRVLAYYDPRVFHRRFHPRWQYAAAYYSPPPPRVYGYRPYGYAYVSRGPAVLVHRYEPRPYAWRRRW